MKKTTTLFKALAHDTRLRILNLLLGGEVCVCRIMEILQLPQSTASRHLGILKNAGLVEDRREGIWVHYSLAREQIPVALQIVEILGKHLPGIKQCQLDKARLAKPGLPQKVCDCIFFCANISVIPDTRKRKYNRCTAKQKNSRFLLAILPSGFLQR